MFYVLHCEDVLLFSSPAIFWRRCTPFININLIKINIMSKNKTTFRNLSLSFARSTEKGNLDICMFNVDPFSAAGSGIPLYLKSDAVRNAIKAQTGEEASKGSIFTIEGEYEIIDLKWVDTATGEVVMATTKEGIALKTIQRVV
jgi:hypothetical protein